MVTQPRGGQARHRRGGDAETPAGAAQDHRLRRSCRRAADPARQQPQSRHQFAGIFLASRGKLPRPGVDQFDPRDDRPRNPRQGRRLPDQDRPHRRDRPQARGVRSIARAAGADAEICGCSAATAASSRPRRRCWATRWPSASAASSSPGAPEVAASAPEVAGVALRTTGCSHLASWPGRRMC